MDLKSPRFKMYEFVKEKRKIKEKRIRVEKIRPSRFLNTEVKEIPL